MNIDDFQRNYQRSYFGISPAYLNKYLAKPVKSDVRWIPCTAPRYGGGGSMRLACIIPLDDYDFSSVQVHVPWEEDMDEKSYIYSTAPRLGIVQLHKSCVYINRSPHRQYHRGYVPASCTSWQAANMYTHEDYAPENYNVVWAVYNNTYTPVYKAVEDLRKGDCLAFALSRQLAVKLSPEYVHPLLWYRREDVGYIDAAQNRCYLFPEASELCEEYVAKICQMPVGRLT